MGAVANMSDGRKGIRASLHYQAPVSGASLPERKEELRKVFTHVLEDLRAEGLEVQGEERISGTAQTMEALVPEETFEDVVSALRERNVRVDVAGYQQVV